MVFYMFFTKKNIFDQTFELSTKTIIVMSVLAIFELVTLGISIYNLYIVPQLFWQIFTLMDIMLHFYVLVAVGSFYYFRRMIKNIWKMQYVLCLELNFVQLGKIIKNKKFESRLIDLG